MTRNVMRGALLTAALAGLLGSSRAGDWPGWRGPTGMGHTSEKDLPLTWGGKNQENVLWKVPLFPEGDKVKLDQNQSSPVVAGNRVFVLTAYWLAGASQKEPAEHHISCY